MTVVDEPDDADIALWQHVVGTLIAAGTPRAEAIDAANVVLTGRRRARESASESARAEAREDDRPEPREPSGSTPPSPKGFM